MFAGSLIGCLIVFSVLANLSATLYNGYKTRKNADEQRAKQEAFQLIVQQNQRDETARLQREMRDASAEDSRMSQERNFLHQQQQAEWKALSSGWPLLIEPGFQLKRFEKIKKKGQIIPLQVFIIEDASLTVPSLHEFYSLFRTLEQKIVQQMSSLCSRNAECSIEVHTHSLKYPATFFGESHISNIYSLYSDVPTVLLTVRFSQDRLLFDSTFWGIGDIASPQFLHVLDFDMQEWGMNQCRISSDNQESNLILGQNSFRQYAEFCKLQEQFRRELQSGNFSMADYRTFILPELKRSYKNLPESVLMEQTEQLVDKLNCILTTWVAAISDVYFLSHEKKVVGVASLLGGIREDFPDIHASLQKLTKAQEIDKNFSLSEISLLKDLAISFREVIPGADIEQDFRRQYVV